MEKQINKEKLPTHIAIIMDGNGRWAKEKGQSRLFGHKAGVDTLKNILRCAGNIGIKYLTVYAFSTENWSRPQDEVSGLMDIFLVALKSEIKELHESDVKITIIGDIQKFSQSVQKGINDAIELTKNNNGIVFNVALNYGGRWDIINAVINIAEDYKQNKINKTDITEMLFSSYLSTKNIPDPELIIRTSGEQRLSGFLLYESVYSELYFTDIYWPAFSENDFYEAIIAYQNRERRLGKISEQLPNN
ncbi:MAG: isoprenyl transferase [Tannerellaceae bacterium]|jgi:undecaprenyl diphosphate synthase|nr:isoprenyl transferase [Tannerellaceae bacterium]